MGSYKLGNGVYGRGKGGEDHSYAKNERVAPLDEGRGETVPR